MNNQQLETNDPIAVLQIIDQLNRQKQKIDEQIETLMKYVQQEVQSPNQPVEKKIRILPTTNQQSPNQPVEEEIRRLQTPSQTQQQPKAEAEGSNIKFLKDHQSEVPLSPKSTKTKNQYKEICKQYEQFLAQNQDLIEHENEAQRQFILLQTISPLTCRYALNWRRETLGVPPPNVRIDQRLSISQNIKLNQQYIKGAPRRPRMSTLEREMQAKSQKLMEIDFVNRNDPLYQFPEYNRPNDKM